MSYASYVSPVSAPDLTNVATAPGMPVFVLNTGTVLSVSGYGSQDNRISYTLVGGGSGVIAADEVDWSTTTKVNNKRGVRVTLHSGKPVAEAPGM